MEAKYLRVGQTFNVSSLDHPMICLRVSPTATYYQTCGGKKDFLSNSTAVAVDESKPLAIVERNDVGELHVVDDLGILKASRSTSVKTGKRGRKKKEVIFPTGQFTIPSLADELGVSTTHIYQAVLAMGKKIKVVDQVRVEGQRGRATKVYQVQVKKKA